MDRPRQLSCRLLALVCAATGLALGATAAESSQEAARFGFTGPENFPIDPFIGQLRSADLDGDGLNDLVIANNSKAKISLLMNRTGKPALDPNDTPGARRDINELPPDARFKIESLTSEKRVAGLMVADLNDDKLPDIVYFGEPKPYELVVHYSQTNLTWGTPKKWQLDEAQLTPNSLAVGDLNGDSKPDVAVLGESSISILTQTTEHGLSEPEKLAFTGGVKAIDIFDINGDARPDLILLNWESSHPIRVRLQASNGRLGPELHFAMPPIRSLSADDLDGDKRPEILTISQTSGRAQISHLVRKPPSMAPAAAEAGDFQILPLAKTSKARKGLVWADVNGDERPDLLIAQPDTGQLTVYIQMADGSLAPSKNFPCLAGVSEIAVSPGAREKSAEIFVLSGDERQIGRTAFTQEGRMAFPTPLPIPGKPLAMAVGSLTAGSSPVLAAIVEVDDRRQLVTGTHQGGFRTQKLAASFKSNPASLRFEDVDQNGLTDLVVLIPYEKVKVLLQVSGKDFEEIDIALPGGGADQPWASSADVDGDGKPELLLAQKNFLRAVVLKKPAEELPGQSNQWSWVVKDQVNGSTPGSRIVAATPLPSAGSSIPLLCLLDADRKVLTLCERDKTGVWQIQRNLTLPYTEFTELRAINLGGPAGQCVALLGANGAGWLSLAGTRWEFSELDGYETLIKDGRLTDAVLGDLNHDGRKDIVFLETGRNHLDIVSYSKGQKLSPGNRWQVFEERSFRSRRGEGTEPREGLITDLNGDGKSDLAIVVHDRILVYLQE
ncbi:MAG: VCBS repeat-containing protein [Verrucomicrobiales bacterium]|nr:VCBS repeat-containing protein [Verrucomicrobiales bacterium]